MVSVLENLKPTLAQLSESDRAELARFLLNSLDDDESEEGVGEAWAAELARRWGEIASGKAVGIPSDVVHAKLREKYP